MRATREEINSTIENALPSGFEFSRVSDNEQIVDTLHCTADKVHQRRSGCTVEQRFIDIRKRIIRKREVYDIKIS